MGTLRCINQIDHLLNLLPAVKQNFFQNGTATRDHPSSGSSTRPARSARSSCPWNNTHTATWSSKGINAEFITMWRKDHSVTSSSSMTTALHLSYDVTSQSWSTSSSSIHVIHLWTFNTSSSFLTSTTDSKCTFFFLWI